MANHEIDDVGSSSATAVRAIKGSCMEQCILTAPDGSKVLLRDPLADPDWDARWSSSSGFTAFHGAAWCRVLQNTYHFSPLYLELKTAWGSKSLLPLMEAQGWLRGRRAVSLPFTDSAPGIFTELEHEDLLLKAALELARHRRWRYVELRGGNLNGRFGGSSLDYQEHTLGLAKTADEMFARFKPELRTAIRKAEKCGLQVEIGSGRRLLDEFLMLHQRTRRRQGIPMQPLRFFGQLQECILDKDGGMVAIARFEEKPIAGAVFLHTGEKSVFKYGASDSTQLSSRPNNLVLWEALKWYIQRGAKSISLGRSSISNLGLRRFKGSWGCAESTLGYFRINSETRQLEHATDASRAWATRLFRMMPRRVSVAVGNLIYRQMD